MRPGAEVWGGSLIPGLGGISVASASAEVAGDWLGRREGCQGCVGRHVMGLGGLGEAGCSKCQDDWGL